MFEWMPVLLGLCLGGLSILAPHKRVHLFLIYVGILLTALGATLLSGEWRLSPIYLALDLIEACAGFVAGAAVIRAVRSTQLS